MYRVSFLFTHILVNKFIMLERDVTRGTSVESSIYTLDLTKTLFSFCFETGLRERA